MPELESNRSSASGLDRYGEALPEPARPLPADRLYRAADLSALPFESTAEIEPADGLIGQERALDAIAFGTRIAAPGFNLFVVGPSGLRTQRAVERVLAALPMPSEIAANVRRGSFQC